MKQTNNTFSQFLLQPLFIKPLYYPGSVLYSRFFKKINATLSFRSFNLDTDLELIHQWVNLEYALPFWQLDGNKQRVYDLYYSIQRNSNGHSYIGLLNDIPVCQFDIYRVLADEIRQYITAGENDCGFHLLMAPNNKPVPGLSLTITLAFLEYYFSFPQAERMFAEPDINNPRSNSLLIRAGFQFLRSIKMSYKTAHLYCLNKQQFEKVQ
jgi:hypothetical protein